MNGRGVAFLPDSYPATSVRDGSRYFLSRDDIQRCRLQWYRCTQESTVIFPAGQSVKCTIDWFECYNRTRDITPLFYGGLRHFIPSSRTAELQRIAELCECFRVPGMFCADVDKSSPRRPRAGGTKVRNFRNLDSPVPGLVFSSFDPAQFSFQRVSPTPTHLITPNTNNCSSTAALRISHPLSSSLHPHSTTP